MSKLSIEPKSVFRIESKPIEPERLFISSLFLGQYLRSPMAKKLAKQSKILLGELGVRDPRDSYQGFRKYVREDLL